MAKPRGKSADVLIPFTARYRPLVGSNTLDGRPSPVARIGWYPEAVIVIACTGCGKHNSMQVTRMVQRFRVDPTTRFHALPFVCMTCGKAGEIREVRGWR